MAKPSSSRRTQTESDLAELEMAAAHQLMQLSDEDNNKVRSRSSYEDESEEVDQSLSDVTSAIIEEIFGKDQCFRPRKQRRYRSLESLYKETRPISAANGKKVRACSQNPK